ncbi:hypothetical protein BC941DRAFT_456034 [Chlamydoabsidia padenii]|nr:hypothetical protein BC941DRAFT_456034 [Chlamydoabsidia padenii]
MLSPDQPPLPTLFPRTDDNVVTAGAALAPMFEHRPFAFTPLTTTQQQPPRPYYISDHWSRPLDPISEESETSVFNNNSKSTTSNHSPFDSKNNSASSFLSKSDPPLSPTDSIQHQESSIGNQLPQPDQQHQSQSPPRRSISSSSISPPPTINTAWHHQQQRSSFDSDELGSPIIGNEIYCKRKFSKMVQAAYHFQAASNLPTTMQAVLDNDDDINLVNTIRLTLSNGQESDCSFTGNPQYIPPEMFIRASYTRGASDVWVLGISLYRMLVGTYPFKATDDRQLITKMLNSDFIIPDHFSEDVKDLLRRMLAPEQTRASLDLIMFHPWLKPYRMVVLPSTPTVPTAHSPPSVKIITTNKKKKPKWRRAINKTCRFIVLGPYPPPSRPYQELAHLGR